MKQRKQGVLKREKDQKTTGPTTLFSPPSGPVSREYLTSFETEEIRFVHFTKDVLSTCGSFQKDFRNADGSPRREKVMLTWDQVKRNTKYQI